MTTEIKKWGESEPSPKKSKKENVEKIFQSCAQEKDKSQQIDEVHGQKQEFRTGG